MTASESDQAVLRATAFDDEIRRRADDIETARRLPDDLAARMAAAGLFRLLVPRRYGGEQVHPRVLFDTLAATARSDGAVGWCQMIGATTGLLAASLPEASARRIYADHPNCISAGVIAPLGRATPVDGGYLVSGRWPFGSACQVADWLCGGCVVMDGDTPRSGSQGELQTILPLFPAADATIHDTWHTSGLCGTGSHDIEVNEVLVPAERCTVLGGPSRVDATLYHFPIIGLLALGIAAVTLGIAERAIEAFVDLATAKTPTGSRRTLAERPTAQSDLARARALTGSARAFTYAAIDNTWEQAADGRLRPEHRAISANRAAELRLAATSTAWSSAEAVDLMYHAAGGSSVYRSNVLQRCFRDVHVATQHIMVARPTWEVVGKVMLGIDPRTLV